MKKQPQPEKLISELESLMLLKIQWQEKLEECNKILNLDPAKTPLERIEAVLEEQRQASQQREALQAKLTALELKIEQARDIDAEEKKQAQIERLEAIAKEEIDKFPGLAARLDKAAQIYEEILIEILEASNEANNARIAKAQLIKGTSDYWSLNGSYRLACSSDSDIRIYRLVQSSDERPLWADWSLERQRLEKF